MSPICILLLLYSLHNRLALRYRNASAAWPVCTSIIIQTLLYSSTGIIQVGGVFLFELFCLAENDLKEFIRGRKVVCRTDQGVKSRKIGGTAGCPRQYAPHSGSRRIGSTSKTILAENCNAYPYIKCPGYRARSREQGQPRP